MLIHYALLRHDVAASSSPFFMLRHYAIAASLLFRHISIRRHAIRASCALLRVDVDMRAMRYHYC